jgi:hypothetical protein
MAKPTHEEVSQLQERINALLKGLDDKYAMIEHAFQRGMRALDEAKEWLGDLVEGARQALIKLRKMVTDVINQMKAETRPLVASWKNMHAMLDMDDKWFDIRNHANGVAQKLSRPADRLDPYWEGPAAAKYYSVVDPQIEAAKRVGVLADTTGKTLQTMATQTVTFYGAAATALTVVIGGLVVAIGTLAAGVTAPLGLAAIGTALAAAVALATAAENFAFQQDANGSVLASEAGNPIGFAVGATGPAWPKAARVSEDVTARDGDPADWKPVHP